MTDAFRAILSLLCNVVIVAWTAVAVYQSVFQKGEDGTRKVSTSTFQYFTTDSNVLAALSALLMIPFGIIGLATGRFNPPAWAVLLKYVGAASVMVTFLTVVAFLGPTQGYPAMFAGHGLYLHLIGPVLAALSFCWPEAGLQITWAQTLLGLLPVLLYGSVYAVQAVKRGPERGGWEDFYGFNVGGHWPVSYVAMHVGAYAISVGLMLLHNLLS